MGVIGAQRPRLELAPDYYSTLGDRAIELVRHVGLQLDDWQQLVLRHAMGQNVSEMWSAPTVGVCVSRQNGKGSILEARELCGLFLLGEQRIVHSAHRMDTSRDHFDRLISLIEASPEMSRRVKKRRGKVGRMTNGQESIDLTTGQRISFRTRSKGAGGRGLGADLLVIDEAMDFPESSAASLLPITSARPNAQTWFVGSAVDQATMPNGLVFARVRKAALNGDPNICWLEWSLDPEAITVDQIFSEAYAAATNPAYGVRIMPNTVRAEQARYGRHQYGVERLSIGDWPDPEATTEQVITKRAWSKLTDLVNRPERLTLAFDIRPGSRDWSIAAAGRLSDNNWHTDVIVQGHGTANLPATLSEVLASCPKGTAIFSDSGQLVDSILPALTAERIKPTKINSGQMAAACEMFLDGVTEGTIRHPDNDMLTLSVYAGGKRPIGTSKWGWTPRDDSADITGLVAASLALYGAMSAPQKRSAAFYGPQDIQRLLADAQTRDEANAVARQPN